MNDDEPQFVDTNILIYAFDRSTGAKHEVANKMVRQLWDTGLGHLSMQVLQEFFVNITRKAPLALEPERAVETLRDLMTWHVHVPGPHDILAAIALQDRYRVSFWDAMILRSAHQSGCEIMWSEDLTDGQDYDGVLVKNPFA